MIVGEAENIMHPRSAKVRINNNDFLAYFGSLLLPDY